MARRTQRTRRLVQQVARLNQIDPPPAPLDPRSPGPADAPFPAESAAWPRAHSATSSASPIRPANTKRVTCESAMLNLMCGASEHRTAHLVSRLRDRPPRRPSAPRPRASSPAPTPSRRRRSAVSPLARSPRAPRKASRRLVHREQIHAADGFERVSAGLALTRAAPALDHRIRPDPDPRAPTTGCSPADTSSRARSSSDQLRRPRPIASTSSASCPRPSHDNACARRKIDFGSAAGTLRRLRQPIRECQVTPGISRPAPRGPEQVDVRVEVRVERSTHPAEPQPACRPDRRPPPARQPAHLAIRRSRVGAAVLRRTSPYSGCANQTSTRSSTSSTRIRPRTSASSTASRRRRCGAASPARSARRPPAHRRRRPPSTGRSPMRDSISSTRPGGTTGSPVHCQ